MHGPCAGTEGVHTGLLVAKFHGGGAVLCWGSGLDWMASWLAIRGPVYRPAGGPLSQSAKKASIGLEFNMV